jgi:hypothetical protein
MRDEDIAFMEQLSERRPVRAAGPRCKPACVADGLSARSRRRLKVRLMCILRRLFSMFYIGFDMWDDVADALWDARCAECAEKGRTK